MLLHSLYSSVDNHKCLSAKIMMSKSLSQVHYKLIDSDKPINDAFISHHTA